MKDTIDVHDLSEKEVMFIQQLVNFLKEKRNADANEGGVKKQKKKIKLPTYPLGEVHGTLSRREIYDYL